MHPLSNIFVQPIYYRPQTKLQKGNVFLHMSVSHSVQRGVSASVHAGIHPSHADTPLGRHPPAQCMLGYTVPSAYWDRHGYCCGRYASYWNAFLLVKNSRLIKSQVWIDPSSIIEKNCFVYEVYSWFSAGLQDFCFQIIFSTAICPWILSTGYQTIITTKVSTVFLTGGSPLGTIIFIGKFSYQGEHMCL